MEARRAYIRASDAGGRAAPEIAGGIVRDIAARLPGWGVKQSALSLGGESAIVLDNVPGQDLSRQAVLFHGNRLYLLTFLPADPEQSGAYAKMQKLYKTIGDSFRFAL